MHILILTTVYPPEVRSASQIMFELAETLKNNGNKVSVITAITEDDQEGQDGLMSRFYQREYKDGIDLIRISTIPIHKSKAPAFLRGIGQLLNGFAYFLVGMFLKNVDVSIAYSPPLSLGLTGWLLKMFKKIPHVFNVQDLVPQYAIDLGILTNKTLIKLIKIIEHFVYKKVDVLTVHSEGNKEYLIGEGVAPEKIHIVYNWVDTSLVKPADKMNAFRKSQGLENSFIVLFAGVLGFAQDLDTVVQSGKWLKDYDDIVILIVGEGVEKDRLMKMADDLNLSNVRFHPFVSKEKYPEVVAASDACLATLQKDLLCPVIPSKILGYMSAARPVVTSLPTGGDAPLVIKNAGSGICVEPGNPEKLAGAVINLYKDREKCEQFGENGRRHIEAYHDRNVCILEYEKIFVKALQK